jgi:hypothetical protein
MPPYFHDMRCQRPRATTEVSAHVGCGRENQQLRSTLAAVDAVRIDCPTTSRHIMDGWYNPILDGFGRPITIPGRERECALIVGAARLPLPAWTDAL